MCAYLLSRRPEHLVAPWAGAARSRGFDCDVRLKRVLGAACSLACVGLVRVPLAESGCPSVATFDPWCWDPEVDPAVSEAAARLVPRASGPLATTDEQRALGEAAGQFARCEGVLRVAQAAIHGTQQA